MRLRWLALSILSGLALLAAAGCGQRRSPVVAPGVQAPAPAAGEKVRLLAFIGSASKPPSLEAKETFEKLHPNIIVDMTFGGSGTLLNQMTLEEAGDIYMPGSDDYMDKAEAQKAVQPETRKIVAYLVPAICVQKGNPKGIKSLKDLARPGIKVGLAKAGAVCLGDVADEVLAKAGVETQVKKNVITYAGSCEQTQQLVQLKEADAVIGWDAFEHWAPDDIEIVSIAPQYLRVRNIPVAIAAYSRHPNECAEFISFLTSEEGRGIFAKHGYSVEPPKVQ